MTESFEFRAKVEVFPGKAAWYYTTVPEDISADINNLFGHLK